MNVSINDILPFWKKYVEPKAEMSEIPGHLEYVFKDASGQRLKKCMLDMREDKWELWVN